MPSSDKWEIEVFYDGACPLCTREMNLLRRRDKHGRIRFTDIAAERFDPAAYGKDREAFTKRIAARLADGSWLDGVEVFRRLYGLTGFGWVVPMTRLAGISQALDLAYDLFARNRHRLTGRCEPDDSCRLGSSSR